MAYKYKPSKAVAKRFRVSATGKLKRQHSLSTHLRSARPSKKKRHLRRPEILFEGHAKNMRRFMAIDGLNPKRTAHRRRLKSQEKAAAESK
jgi:large subunit ribosomal protein L35